MSKINIVILGIHSDRFKSTFSFTQSSSIDFIYRQRGIGVDALNSEVEVSKFQDLEFYKPFYAL